jgi:hypothetical protein
MIKLTKRAAALVFVLLCFAAGMFPSPSQQEAKPEEKARPQLLRLVRSDLLELEAKPLAPPLRNIFAPHRTGSGQGRPGAPGSGGPDDPSAEETEELGEEGEEIITVVYDLRYIGYVRSSDRIVGVVVFEGETLAVKPGDLISAGVTILKITPEEIVFQGTDAVSRTVSLEGEDQ